MEHDNKILLVIISALVIVFVANFPASIKEIRELASKAEERISLTQENLEDNSFSSFIMKLKNLEDRIWNKIKGVEPLIPKKYFLKKQTISKKRKKE